MAITCVTFDWGDTIASNHGNPSQFIFRRGLERLAAAVNCHGGHANAQWVEASFTQARQAMRDSTNVEKNPHGKEIDLPAMIATWVHGAGVNPDQVPDAIAAFGQEMTTSVQPLSDTKETLMALKALGLRVGILSHVTWPGKACREWFHRYDLAKYVDFYSLSGEVGWIKPAPQHYQDTLKQAGCPVGEILHVGDHPDRDITGAKAFGFQTCLKLTEGIYPPEKLAACKPDFTVAWVGEVVGIVKGLKV
jgi:HAD superfamily hydrolase (TIGR01549 family)